MSVLIERKRHLAKAVTWRLGGSIATVIIAYVFGIPYQSLGFVFAADLIMKFAMYYLHERIWYKYIKLGIKNENI